MKKINSYIIFLLLLLTTSCKSQININKTKTVVSSIKDTIACDGVILSNYNLPFFNFESKKSSETLNHIIKKDVEEFIFINNKNIIDSISLKKTINNFTNYLNTECCSNNCYSFNNGNYSINFLNKHIVSIQLDIETYTAYLTRHTYIYNFNIDNSELITIKDFFNNTDNELVNIIQKRINKEYPDEFTISEIPELWIITKNQKKILGIKFTNGLVENLRDTDNDFPLYEVFFTFNELENYITEGFKKKLRKQ